MAAPLRRIGCMLLREKSLSVSQIPKSSMFRHVAPHLRSGYQPRLLHIPCNPISVRGSSICHKVGLYSLFDQNHGKNMLSKFVKTSTCSLNNCFPPQQYSKNLGNVVSKKARPQTHELPSRKVATVFDLKNVASDGADIMMGKNSPLWMDKAVIQVCKYLDQFVPKVWEIFLKKLEAEAIDFLFFAIGAAVIFFSGSVVAYFSRFGGNKSGDKAGDKAGDTAGDKAGESMGTDNENLIALKCVEDLLERKDHRIEKLEKAVADLKHTEDYLTKKLKSSLRDNEALRKENIELKAKKV